MRKNVKKVIASMVLVSAFLVNSVQSQATTKSWKVYHSQGAPSDAGVFKSARIMPAGGTVVAVNMTSYTNLSNTIIKTYRSKFPSDYKFLTATNKQQVLYVVKDKKEKVVVKMSTTSGKSTSASGNFIR